MTWELIDTRRLLPYREFDRRPGSPHGRSAGEYEQLRDQILRDGVQHPLTLNFNPNTGLAYLGEGNTRLAVALELGISRLPVRVIRWRNPSDYVPGAPMRYQGGRLGGDPEPPSKFLFCDDLVAATGHVSPRQT
jgi:hypothetical protein